MSEPRTAAGQRLLRTLDYIGVHSQDTSFPMALDDILDIEREVWLETMARMAAVVEPFLRHVQADGSHTSCAELIAFRGGVYGGGDATPEPSDRVKCQCPCDPCYHCRGGGPT